MISQGQATSQYVWSGQPTTTANFTHDQLNRDAAMAAASGYDANGNLISDGVRTFTYDAENRLTSVTGGTAPVTLAYDPWGRLSTTTASGATTMFAYSGDQLIGEFQQSSTGPGPSSALREYIYSPNGELLAWHTNPSLSTTVNWFHTDRLGSVVATSDAFATMTPYTYGPYGEPQSWAGSRFRYTGQMAIPEAQLYHYRARAYDPMMGRFLQTDPVRYGDGPNIYAYVHGDPVNDTDPTGDAGFVDFFLNLFKKTNGGECNDCDSGAPSQSGGSTGGSGSGGSGGGDPGVTTVSPVVLTGPKTSTTNTAATSTVPFGVGGSNPSNGDAGGGDAQNATQNSGHGLHAPVNPKLSACIQAAVQANSGGIALDVASLGFGLIDGIPAAGAALFMGGASMVNSAVHGDPAGVGIGATGYHVTAFAPLVAKVASSGGNLLLKGAGAAVGGIGLVRDTQAAMNAINDCYAKYQ